MAFVSSLPISIEKSAFPTLTAASRSLRQYGTLVGRSCLHIFSRAKRSSPTALFDGPIPKNGLRSSPEEKGPGFFIINKTNWPLQISLGQIGQHRKYLLRIFCLYVFIFSNAAEKT